MNALMRALRAPVAMFAAWSDLYVAETRAGISMIEAVEHDDWRVELRSLVADDAELAEIREMAVDLLKLGIRPQDLQTMVTHFYRSQGTWIDGKVHRVAALCPACGNNSLRLTILTGEISCRFDGCPDPTALAEAPRFAISAAHLARQREFSAETFGPGNRLQGVLDHIRKELLEVEAAPGDISEWADVLILAFDGALRQGHEPQAVLDAVLAKQTRNEGREWPDWRTQPSDKAIEHVREPGESYRSPIDNRLICGTCGDEVAYCGGKHPDEAHS